MSSGGYEIEIKCLLGNRENAERLEAQMKKLDPKLRKIGSHKQLNHYFEGNGDAKAVAKVIADEKDRKDFLDLAKRAKDFSLRTREADGKVLLVLKATIDDTTSANGTARREFECEVAMPLSKLDEAVLGAGFTYQAKWSRERMEYKFFDANVTIDKNAGYGYLAEFEIIASDPSHADGAKAKLREIIKNVGLEELNQARLERMFAHYNAHWPEYYGTEKTFVIE
ncbi:MAG: CYTH domain-containing protein [Minisyncoccia bacterium]|jgi:predicted adenylyl cyclase CyaB